MSYRAVANWGDMAPQRPFDEGLLTSAELCGRLLG
jgi:hypothetical protein